MHVCVRAGKVNPYLHVDELRRYTQWVWYGRVAAIIVILSALGVVLAKYVKSQGVAMDERAE